MLETLFPETEGSGEYPSLTAEELFQAKSHLYKGLEILQDQFEQVKQGAYDSLRMASELSECWLEVNKCRVYTEKILEFEEHLQPAMGLIYDAKCMIEHLAAQELGLTKQGRISILQTLSEAWQLIQMVLRELEFWDTTEQAENE
ncbi:MAG: hypothetical protein WCA08_05980 [Desulfoferrobacter sp.]